MAQQGSLYMHHGSWYVRYWVTVRNADGSLSRKNPAERLASAKDYPKRSEVIPLKNRFMESLNAIGFVPELGISLIDFVEETFLPACSERLSGAGTKCYRDTWNCHLKQHVAGVRLRDVRPVHVQSVLSALGAKHGTTLAHSTYRTMKVTLSAIFTEARNLGLYDGVNPTTGVRVPKGRKHGRKRLAYSLEEILRHLDLFSRDPVLIPTEEGTYKPQISAGTVRAIIGVTGFGGLRLGEVRDLWWDDDREDVLAICRSMWRSTLKNTKTVEDVDDPGSFRSFGHFACCSTRSSLRALRDSCFQTGWEEHLISRISRTGSSGRRWRSMDLSGRAGTRTVAVSQQTSRICLFRTQRSRQS